MPRDRAVRHAAGPAVGGESGARFAKRVATKPFYFRPRGMLASIGHRNAVAVIYGVKLSGFIAWFLWRGIYLAKLPTLSRKLEVAINWACEHSVSAEYCSASAVEKANAGSKKEQKSQPINTKTDHEYQT
jgi:hypothetical protein